MKKEEILQEIADLRARREAIIGEEALIEKRLDELYAMLIGAAEAEIKEMESEEPEEGEDVVSDILNSPMDDEQRELLIVAGLIEPEKPKDPPTEELIATPEEAKAAEEALGKVEEVAPPPSKPKARVSAMSRLSAKKADSEPEDDDDDDDDDDEDELEFLSGDPDENGEYPDPDD